MSNKHVPLQAHTTDESNTTKLTEKLQQTELKDDNCMTDAAGPQEA